jgi:hypothetical protein
MKIRANLLTAAMVLVPAAAASQPATTTTDQSATQAQDSSKAPAPAAKAPAATAPADATCATPGKSETAKGSADRPDSVKSVTKDTGELGTTKAKKPDKETACADQPL